MACEGIEADKRFEASFRPVLYLAARIIWRLGADKTMHLLMIVFRWLLGFLPGGVQAALAELVYGSVRLLGGPARYQWFFAPEVPRAGWMKVRPVLEKCGGPPGRHSPGVPVDCRRGGAMRLCPVQSDRVSRGPMSASNGNSNPSKPAPPVWG